MHDRGMPLLRLLFSGDINTVVFTTFQRCPGYLPKRPSTYSNISKPKMQERGMPLLWQLITDNGYRPVAF